MCTGQSYLSHQVQAVWALTDRQYKLMVAVTHTSDGMAYLRILAVR